MHLSAEADTLIINLSACLLAPPVKDGLLVSPILTRRTSQKLCEGFSNFIGASSPGGSVTHQMCFHILACLTDSCCHL